MPWWIVRWVGLLVAAAALLACKDAQRRSRAGARLATAPSVANVSPQQAMTWGSAPILLAAQVVGDPDSAMDLVPGGEYSIYFQARVTNVFRGQLERGETLPLALSSPRLIDLAGKCLFLGLQPHIEPIGSGRSRLAVAAYELCSDLTDKALKSLALAPLGWSVTDGRWRSPWADARGGRAATAWPMLGDAGVSCAVTGRPGWLLPSALELTLQPRLASSPRFRLALTNTGDSVLDAPALVSRAGRPAWDESLLIQVAGGSIQALAAPAVDPPPTVTRLGPGQSILHQLDVAALLVEGVGVDASVTGNLPISIFLGDRAVTDFVYYGASQR